MRQYRAALRNVYHELPRKSRKANRWSAARTKTVVAPPVKPNKRDRSIEREEHITMDFTGPQGLALAQITHNASTLFPGKPKRGWAAKRRAKPFANFLRPDKMEQARLRHKWGRQQKAREEFEARRAAE